MKYRYILFMLSFLPVSPVSATNFYAGANIGLLEQEGKFKVINGTLDSNVGITRPKDYMLPDGSELTKSLYVGYKLATDLFFEVGIARNDDVAGDIREQPVFSGEPDRGAYEKYETDYIYAAFVAMWPVANNMAFSTRLGFSVWDINYRQYSADIPPGGLPTTVSYDDLKKYNNVLAEQYSDNTSAMLFGVGLSYAFDRHLEFKLSVEKHFVDFSFTNLDLDYDAVSVTLGTAYHF